MRTYYALLKRELFAFFVTPLAWILIVVFLVVQGLHFALLVDHYATTFDVGSNQTLLSTFFGNTVLLYLVLFLLIPPITMRLLAEERRNGTIETLMTAPVSAASLVLAKYTASLVTYVAMWAPTTLYLLILRRASAVDLRAAGAAYLGVLLVGAGYLALGLLASAVTKSQFIALVLTALVILVFFLLGIAEFVSREGTLLHEVARHVSVWAQMNDFAQGIVDSRRVAFDLTMVALPLYVAVRAVDAWKWS